MLIVVGTMAAAAEDVSEQILAKAIDDFRAGRNGPVIGGINAAMRGRLPAAQVARAHYYRGLAYRKANQPGQAITDLTRALEYDGLSESERSDAAENLQVAYQEAGIGGGEKVFLGSTRAAPSPSSSAPQPAVIGDTGATTAKKQTAGTKPADADSKPSAAETAAKWAPVSASGSAAWTTQQVALAPLPPIVLPTRAPRDRGGVEAAPPPATRPVSTFVTEVIAAPAVDQSAGGVRLLVGETGSRNEAFALAVRLTSQHGAELGPRLPQIAEDRLTGAPVYRLRLGPFADSRQAMELCRSLRDGGNACVTE